MVLTALLHQVFWFLQGQKVTFAIVSFRVNVWVSLHLKSRLSSLRAKKRSKVALMMTLSRFVGGVPIFASYSTKSLLRFGGCRPRRWNWKLSFFGTCVSQLQTYFFDVFLQKVDLKVLIDKTEKASFCWQFWEKICFEHVWNYERNLSFFLECFVFD